MRPTVTSNCTSPPHPPLPGFLNISPTTHSFTLPRSGFVRMRGERIGSVAHRSRPRFSRRVFSGNRENSAKTRAGVCFPDFSSVFMFLILRPTFAWFCLRKLCGLLSAKSRALSYLCSFFSVDFGSTSSLLAATFISLSFI